MNSVRTTAQSMTGRIRDAIFGSRGTLLDHIETHDNNYNLIRFVLAASVILFHANFIAGISKADPISRHLYPTTTLGGLAVQCFFFLSGLFVSQSIFKDGNLIDFSIKRCMRIFPGLVVCTAVSVLVLSLASLGRHFWTTLALPQTYDYILKTGLLIDLQWSVPGVLSNNPSQTINGSIHTLPTELKMYVMLGLLGFMGLVRRKIHFGIVSAMILAMMAIVGQSTLILWRVPSDAFAMVFLFVVGMLAYACADQLRINLAQGLVLALLLRLSGHDGLPRAIALYGFTIWAMLYIGQWRWLRRVLHPRTDPSYGIYIYGWPCQQLVKTLLPSADGIVVTLAALPLAFVAALLSWNLVEKPSMDMAKRIAKERGSLSALRTSLISSGTPWSTSFRCQLALLALCLALSRLTDRVNLLPTTSMATQIVDYGPHEASAAEGFNVQPDGVSAIWLKLSSPPPSGVTVIFDGHRLDTTSSIHSDVVTAAVPKALLRSQGNKQVFLRSLAGLQMQESNKVDVSITR
jgi:peptidoglycan/LPS O-acetylase OafA/YrhL